MIYCPNCRAIYCYKAAVRAIHKLEEEAQSFEVLDQTGTLLVLRL